MWIKINNKFGLLRGRYETCTNLVCKFAYEKRNNGKCRLSPKLISSFLYR